MNLGIRRPERAVLILAAAFFLLALPTLNNSHPYQGDESYYTISAVKMAAGGDWLAPSYFGAERFNKPVLAYWIVAAAYKALGISMWSGRVPMVLLACIAIFFTYRLAWLVFGSGEKALLAAAITAASPMFLLYARVAMTEIVLLLFSVLSLLAYATMIFRQRGSLRYSVLGAAFAGLAFMTKGPAGLLPLLAAVVFCAFSNRRRLLWTLFHPAALAVLAVVAVPWYVYAAVSHPQAFSSNVSAEAGVLWKSFDLGRIVGHLGYYAYSLFVYTFPFLPAAAVLFAFRRGSMRYPAWGFLMTYAVIVLAVFAFLVAMHRARYLLPLIPLAGIFGAHVLYSKGGRAWFVTALAVLGVQFAFYLAYPLIANNALRKLTYEWKGKYSASGTLGFVLPDPKERGWCVLYANNRNLAPAEEAGYLLVEGPIPPEFKGWRVLRSEKQNHSVRFERGSFLVTGPVFHLLERPGAGFPK